MAETFLYGAYAVMFGFYIYILHTRRVPQNRFLAAATILLFIFCTGHLGLLLATTAALDRTAETSANGDPSYLGLQLNFAENVIYVTSNVIADSIFVLEDCIDFPMLCNLEFQWPNHSSSDTIDFRCCRRSIIVSDRVFNCSIATSVFTTLQLMTLSAGRIWWLARKAREVLGQEITTRYNTACMMIPAPSIVSQEWCNPGTVGGDSADHH
ncbi:hypothetical protein K438DRAFT_2168138 [Mycena galopus ATCC 62051]|nr:hypothetical protein K438DRAFT_2168138 [Mycena galopus ATCC 62051]